MGFNPVGFVSSAIHEVGNVVNAATGGFAGKALDQAQQLESAGFGVVKNVVDAAGKTASGIGTAASGLGKGIGDVGLGAGKFAGGLGDTAKYLPYILIGGLGLGAAWLFMNPGVVKSAAE